MIAFAAALLFAGQTPMIEQLRADVAQARAGERTVRSLNDRRDPVGRRRIREAAAARASLERTLRQAEAMERRR